MTAEMSGTGGASHTLAVSEPLSLIFLHRQIEHGPSEGWMFMLGRIAVLLSDSPDMPRFTDFHDNGFVVYTSRTVQDARAMVGFPVIDLLLIDEAIMADGASAELMSRVKSRHPQVRTVLLSTQHASPHASRFDEVMPKPPPIKDFFHRLEQLRW